MYSNHTIAIVVPAYNEENLINKVIETMPSYVDYIVVVDDCSKDCTVDRIREHVEGQPERIILIQHEVNQGVGGAIASGYVWCRDHNIDIAGVMAGDAQMDPEDLPAILDPIVSGRADYTKGNRLFTGDAWNQIPRIRYLGNAALSLLTKIASGYWRVADSQCGYTAINHKALKMIHWDQMYKRYGMPNDLLVRLNIFNFRVVDVPVKPIYYTGAKSGIKPLRMIPRLSIFLLKLFVYRMVQKYIIRDFHPLVFFYAFSTVLLGLFAPILTARLLIMWAINNKIPPINALTVIVVVITGLQFLLFAMQFDMEYNKDLC
jgi:glycosyltransferase involved in cell wall biosynthesis